MAKYAIISDIHANLAALEAVLADIDSVGVSEIWCLGDIVGYGPQPVECLKLAKERCSIIIKGNHEGALVPGGGERFNARAKSAIDWTRQAISASPGGAEWLEWIAGLPTHFKYEDILFVHGSPREPTEEYLMPRDARNMLKMQPQFDTIERYAFCGHTHFPGVFEENELFCPPEDMLGGNLYMLDYEVKAIINVGSVGQPRDRNNQSCYVTFDGDSAVYRRVKYDFNKTKKLIEAVPDLDNFLGERLVLGK
ncbi:MAG: metallophosphoesterase family protein [Planctomycetes bacterium]|nr:metallophosphoesterase family protein [Planctomycetota bacterium]